MKADGLRYQGIARVYEQLQSNVPVSGGSDFAWSDWAIGAAPGSGLLSSSASDSWLVGSSTTACSQPESCLRERTERASGPAGSASQGE